MNKFAENIGDIISLVSPDKVYVIVDQGVYDGDPENGIHVDAVTDFERAKSIYLSKAAALEKYFLKMFEEHAIINRSDESLYFEAYQEGDYLKYHATVFVKTIEL